VADGRSSTQQEQGCYGGRVSLKDIVVPFGLILVVGCMIIPLPAAVLDLLLCSNLLFALLMVIGALHVRDPLKVTALPSLLLMATLFRLSLNLATTRAVLTHGHAGKAVEAFGAIVIQGSVVVGFVLFLLITLIQFIVVAKGAERVAEVAARFTLDALPGKQMAIDAEIRSGLLDPEEARRKRGDIQTESRFYGALDGAMKFVKGDAVAGIVITAVNIVGGLIVGLCLQELELAAAIRKFTVLTIGDGLLSQIPSLLNAIAAGLIVTRVQAQETTTLASDLLMQVAQFRTARAFVAAAACMLALLPGMPHVALAAVGLAVAISLLLRRAESSSDVGEHTLPVFEPTLAQSIHIEVAREAVSVLPELEKISGAMTDVRSYAFSRWGLVLVQPSISLWSASEATYRVLIKGMEVMRSSAEPSEGLFSEIQSKVQEVVDLYRCDLIDDGATRRALDYVEKQVPELVTGVVPAALSLTSLTALLRNLLQELVPIRHMDVVLQVIAERAGRIDERALLAEVRQALGPVISARVAPGGAVEAAVISPVLDLIFVKAEEAKTLISVDMLERVYHQVEQLLAKHPQVTFVCSKRSRAYVRDILKVRWDDLRIVAHEEIVTRVVVRQIAVVELDEQSQREALLRYAA
jgi:flagellar biosynthesis component FlhA